MIRRLFIGLSISCLATHAASWQLHTPVSTQKPTAAKSSFKRLEAALDYGAFAYAAYRIGALYNAAENAPENSWYITSCLKRCAHAVLPQAITQASSHVQFACAALGIIGKTLLYKTIARLLLLCGDADLLQLLQTKRQHCAGENP